MVKDWKSKRVKELLKAFSMLENDKDFADFLRDVATIKEIEAMAERWEVAKLLHKGMSYRDVSKATGASTTTVTRVAQWLNNGEGGYKNVLKMIDKK